MQAPDKEESPLGETAGLERASAWDGDVQIKHRGLEQSGAYAISELPAPPYPSRINGKPNKAGGFKFELDIERMQQSDTWAIAEARQRPFLVMLWIVSWTQLPAGTLPDDDAVIAARIGMPLQEFRGCRDVLMRGWWKASDGRLYHAVIAEQVIDLMKRKASAAARQRTFRGRQTACESDSGEEPDDDKPDSDANVTRYSGVTDDEVTSEPTVSHSTTTNTITTTSTNTNTTSTSKETNLAPIGARLRHATPVLQLPDWLPARAWIDWHDYRRKRTPKGWTPKAQELSVSTLAKLRNEGHDPVKVIEASIENGWTGLFPLKTNNKNSRGNTNADQRQPGESVADYVARVNRAHDEREAGIRS